MTGPLAGDGRGMFLRFLTLAGWTRGLPVVVAFFLVAMGSSEGSALRLVESILICMSNDDLNVRYLTVFGCWKQELL